MSLPVSQYEALLAEVRGLRRKAQRVQQLATPLLSSSNATFNPIKNLQNVPPSTTVASVQSYSLDYKMDSLGLDRQHNSIECDPTEIDYPPIYNENEHETRNHSTQVSVSSEPISQENRDMSLLYHGTWPVERAMWNSEPTSLGPTASCCSRMDMTSVMSFAYSSGGAQLDRVLNNSEKTQTSSQQLEAKVDMVYSLLSMLGGQEHADMGATLLALSTNPESCLAMRQSGCIPLLVQLVQSDRDAETRKKAAQALNNLIHTNPDEKLKKRETRVLKLLDQLRAYVAYLHNQADVDFELPSPNEDGDKHPVQTVAHLMKLSFDETHRQAICQLGGIHTLANLVQSEHAYHGSTMEDGPCVLLRRYSCMALTNLTFGDSGNKALLCSFKDFICALVVQLQSPCDELRQVTASVLRNLSWRADTTSKEILREVGTVTGLMKAAMLNNKENTLKSILSALWNLSAHCTENKAEICEVTGALGFLVDMLSYKTPSKSLVIIENAGGILRNISSQIAVREDYRDTLRQHNCLQVLLEQLKSPSLTIVSNACGTLWNLSAKNKKDQETLWLIGAPAMLRSLNHSKHKMIAMGSSAALKNLLSSRPSYNLTPQVDSTAQAMDLPTLPTLGARKQKALLQELEQNLSETFENIDKDSPTKSTPESSFTKKSFTKGKKNLHPAGEDRVSRAEKNIYEPSLDSGELNDSFITKFNSLTINEPLNSYQNRTRISQAYENTSLPYIKSSVPYIPLQKYTSCAYEEDPETTEQPVDYSRKYSETKLTKNFNASSSSNASNGNEKNFSYSNGAVEDETYGIYTETDLDQPTDYSLRYAEDDLESDVCGKIEKTVGDFVQDTVKTYCTEDTPYETPFNNSNATSMSDLRDTNLDGHKQKSTIDNNKATHPSGTKDRNREKLSQSDEKDRCSVEDVSETNNASKTRDKTIKSEFSSGLVSPEKPFGYAEEGTPGYFSRVSSLSSLSSVPVGDKVPCKNEIKRNTEQAPTTGNEQKQDALQPEAKAVKFEQMVNYAEETPLMFSRSSSLASLDSIEQHSIHEDRESVISDFSRLTSGLVSPSELPDSPTQTVPPSPRLRKTSMEFATPNRNSYGGNPGEHAVRSTSKTNVKSSIFEDNVTTFKEESTPMHFSTATSLSSLTIDDHDDATHFKTKGSATKPSKANSSKTETPQKNDDGNQKGDEEDESPKNVSANEDNLVISESEEDEDILAACISDGMQNNRHRQADSSCSKLPAPAAFKYQPKLAPRPSGIPLARSGIRKPITRSSNSPIRTTDSQLQGGINSDSIHNYCTEDTPAMLSHANSNSDLSVLTTTTDHNPKKEEHSYLSDDSSNLSGDNENILAECIQSAMPKARKFKPAQASGLPMRNLQTSSPVKPFLRMNQNCGRNFELKAEGCTSPIDPNLKAPTSPNSNFCETSSNATDALWAVSGARAEACNFNNFENHVSSGNNEQKLPLSRQNSLSSLSADSLASLEQEQALLEQCISSGMPKSKHSVPSTPDLKLSSHNSQLKAAAARQYNVEKNENSFEIQDLKLNETQILIDERSSKNVNVTSAVRSMLTETDSPTIPAMVAGVESIEIAGRRSSAGRTVRGIRANITRDKVTVTREDLSIQLTSSGSESSPREFCHKSESCSTKNVEHFQGEDKVDGVERNGDFDFENINLEVKTTTVDTRMLDPDAMIESLDRFTAELVSQAEAAHSNKDGQKLISSVNDGDTWNESSSNDITFPTISGSAPNVVTFGSENKDDKNHSFKLDIQDELACNYEEQKSNDFSSMNTNSTMTDSTIIAAEATKIAAVLRNEVDMVQSITSVNSLELDGIQPPSHMNSLTNSINGAEQFQYIRDSPKLVRRKRSLQSGLLARRALSNSLNQTSSLESLDNHSLSNLDHVNPPSAMGEVLDLIDMEGSMISVASLTSEIFDSKHEGDREPNPIFNLKQPCALSQTLTNNFVISDLENINPPSLFNEITDLCNSLADVTTEVICSETEAFEDCNTHVIEANLQTEDDVTHFSDAQSITPIQSDLSSAETSPKKVKTLNKRLTPKQKRKLVQERYRTYTVAAEMVVSEEFGSVDNLKTDDCFSEYHSVNEGNDSPLQRDGSNAGSGKSTPRERRKNDRARFQTQVLDEAVTSALQKMCRNVTQNSHKEEKAPDSSPLYSIEPSPQQSPRKGKLNRKQNFLQKRIENKDRFRTRTLSESSLSPDISQTQSCGSNSDLHNLVQKEANKVLKNLKETRLYSDELLDCETLSLISNEDDSEHNSGGSINYRTYTKNYVGQFTSKLAVEQKAQKQSTENSKKVPTRLENVQTRPGTENLECNPEVKKPKIKKPGESQSQENLHREDEEREIPKPIRGRRKPLYSKTESRLTPRSNVTRPIRNITSNLVKNVTSVIKSGTNLKNAASKQAKANKNVPNTQVQVRAIKPPSGYMSKISARINSTEKTTRNTYKNSTVNSQQHKSNSPRSDSSQTPPLERQGTFTKEPEQPKSQIPTATSSNLPIPKFASRIAKATSLPTPKTTTTKTQNSSAVPKNTKPLGSTKSLSSDRSTRIKSASSGIFSRSSSADSRDASFNRKMNPSSSQNFRSENGTVKRSSLTNISCRSNSNSSITSSGSGTKKQIASKIASYWKSDSQKVVKNTQSKQVASKITRSNTFETKDAFRLNGQA